MLRSLFIQNYALIEKLDIDFSTGFSVITGETGAGKSIILGAIGLLLGQRADVKSIRYGVSKCIIEARFDISTYVMNSFFEENDLEYDAECILRREVYASGKSRAFINDTPVSLALIRELGEQLIDVHSQHQNLLLNKEDFQLNVLDILAHNADLLAKYRDSYNTWRELEREQLELTTRAEQSKSDEDFIRFQLEQLEEASLNENEQGELEQEAEMLSHSEEIKSVLYKVDQLFTGEDAGLLSAMKDGLSALLTIQKVYIPAEELADRMESSYIELKDIIQEVSMQSEAIEFNPVRLEEINGRLNLIYSLQQKHHVKTVKELIVLMNDFQHKLDEMTSYDEQIAKIIAKKEAVYKALKEQASVLTKKRMQAANEVQKQMGTRLIPLGIPNIRFQVEMGLRKEVGPSGENTVAFLFSANKNGLLQNISSVASGGEIARVMLSIKAMIAGAVNYLLLFLMK